MLHDDELIIFIQPVSIEAEDIYQVPGGDEDTLYAQLNEIVSTVVTRDTVL